MGPSAWLAEPGPTAGTTGQTAVAGEGDAEDEGGRPARAMAGREIDVSVEPRRFTIIDDCGGIEPDDAIRYAFRLGRLEDVEPIEGQDPLNVNVPVLTVREVLRLEEGLAATQPTPGLNGSKSPSRRHLHRFTVGTPPCSHPRDRRGRTTATAAA